VQLGRRFRALKLWMILRHFGAEACARGSRAQSASPGVRRLGGRGSGLRARGAGAVQRGLLPGEAGRAGLERVELEKLNADLLDAVNASGEVFLSHTKLDGASSCASPSSSPHRGTARAEAWELLRRNVGR